MSGQTASELPLASEGVAGVQVVVMAKAPLPGHVKTRLCPPLSYGQAAILAEAALNDTLDAVTKARPARQLIALAGPVGRWCQPGFEVVSQRGHGLGERLDAAASDVWSQRELPLIFVGMDTPQLSPEIVSDAAATLLADGVDAVLGPALDGGFWCIGVREPHVGLCKEVPMSAPRTGERQLARFRDLGLNYTLLDELRDVDILEDAVAVGAAVPCSRFSRVLGELRVGRAVASMNVGS